MKIQVFATVTYPVQVNTEIEVPDDLNDDEKQDFLREKIKEEADMLFPISSITPVIHEGHCSPYEDWNLAE
jgi:hypothetical protein